MQGKKRNKDMLEAYEAIMRSDLSELEKVRDAFKLVIDFYVREGEREIEVLRAMHDRENMIKEQIKVSTMQSAQTIFADAYRRATGRSAGHDTTNGR